MRIIHIVPLLSDDGSFGGPFRVALNQVRELRARGHEAEIITMRLGHSSAARSFARESVRAFRGLRVPGLRFTGLISLELILWLLRNRSVVDVLHVHASRDLVSMSAMAASRFLPRARIIVQTHGMIQPSGRIGVRVFDSVLTTRLIVRSHVVLTLTNEERAGLQRLEPSICTMSISNGLQGSFEHAEEQRDHEVLFLARLQERKRPVQFVETAAELHHRFPTWKWTIVGPDDGQLSRVKEAIEQKLLQDIVTYEGSLGYAEVERRLSRASVYVLPSVDEPFPMSLLEAMQAGLACVLTRSCGIAETLEKHQAALVADPNLPSIVRSVGRILEDHELRMSLKREARRVVKSIYSIEAVVDRLLDIYGGSNGSSRDCIASEEAP
ncbi:glycosyltransferase [Actinomycetospora cinnamomea]|uniref:Glycosyltransferase involved in cell wall biosynthesis n=1 Tax=Actinomycetospora cinnamomea TaxID=663609 RepID=A0A2U1EVM6_9PSEU|nr:glycosyltransferase [Actinomycetospora cinnamomea]PVZ03961.1 glycosyltransferase involved in cell wall biosynthesis [Actinomycetospora cinnamomea]